MRILLCEDEKNLNNLIKTKLESEGYAVDSCFDGQDGLSYVESTEYDLVILDIMMPKLTGFDVIKKMRENGIDYPVLFLTARDSTEDIVSGLDMGANDYIVKPFMFSELLARIRVIIRTKPQKNASFLKINDLVICTNTKTVKRGDLEIKLTLKEYSILEYMAMNKGIALTKEQIEEHIWNFDFDSEGGLIKVYISYLRKKIDGNYTKKLIHTVRGVGYMIKEV